MRRSKLKSNGRIFLLNDFCERGNELFLYEGYEEKYHTFGYFLECGLRNSEFCGYVYPRESEKMNLEHYLGSGAQVHHFPITDEKIRLCAGST